MFQQVVVVIYLLLLLWVEKVDCTSYSWTSLTSLPTSAYWVGATISNSGQNMAVAAGYVAGPNILGGIYLSSDSGSSWVQSSAGTTTYWTSICSDATGQYLVAGADTSGIWISTNTGTIWQLGYATSSNVQGVACTTSGSNVYAILGTGAVLGSTTQGFTWNTLFTSTAGTANGIASDNTGTILLASYSNGYYLSINAGATWNHVYSTSSAALYHLAMSGSGLYQIGNMDATSGSGGVLLSTNNGTSFAFSLNAYDVYAVAMSKSGQTQLAIAQTTLYASFNYGMTNSWSTLTTSSSSLQSIACNEDASYILMGEEHGSVYLGVAQTPTLSPTRPPTSFPTTLPTATLTATTPVTLSYTGAVQTYPITTSTTLQIEACGASGGTFSGTGQAGGKGGCITSILTVPTGTTTLYVYVGGEGTGGSNSVYSNAGGFNGGGNGVYGSGGGGASDVRTSEYDLTTRIVIASGGGGGGGNSGAGGNGGGTSGAAGVASYGSAATGGSQLAGGTGGYCAGKLQGGSCPTTDQGGSGSYGYGGAGGTGGGDNGGGGAGYYGGGGGAGDGGGGGGSSYYTGTLVSDVSGTNSGNGFVIITAIPPTQSPTFAVTAIPTHAPTTRKPSHLPTKAPTTPPTALPTATPTCAPTTHVPTQVPSTQIPSPLPTRVPSSKPTTSPSTTVPSLAPTLIPSCNPTIEPTDTPNAAPTASPTAVPSQAPTTDAPTAVPSAEPLSHRPTVFPTELPTNAPTTHCPSVSPSTQLPSPLPTLVPTTVVPTTVVPTTETPSVEPLSRKPTVLPTTAAPTTQPSTTVPTFAPSWVPSCNPTIEPTDAPTAVPSAEPLSHRPTVFPTELPTNAPTTHCPSVSPTTQLPSPLPTVLPTTAAPTVVPSTQTPSMAPTPNQVPLFAAPSLQPIVQPTSRPSVSIASSQQPSPQPTMRTLPPITQQQASFAPTSEPENNHNNASTNAVNHFDCLVATYCGSSDDNLLGLSLTLGALVLVFTSLALYWRDSFDQRVKLNESKSFTGEMIDAFFRAFNVICAMFAMFTANHAASQTGLILSRLIIFVISCVLLIRLVWSPMVFPLLHRASFEQFLGLSVYGLLVVVSSLDVMVWKLLPWRATIFTSVTAGYPDIVMMRCLLYGNFVSIALQTVSGYLGFVLEPAQNKFYTHFPALYVLYLLVSSLNLLRSLISVMFFVLLASTNELQVTVIQQSELDDIKSRQNSGMGVEFNTIANQPAALNPLDDQPSIDLEANRSSTIAMTTNPLHNNQTEKLKQQQKKNAKVEVAVEEPEEAEDDAESEEARKQRLYATAIPFAEKNVDILKKQLADLNVMPLQYIPLSVLKEEVDVTVQKINRGEVFDEGRLDYLLRCMDVNPEYVAEKQQQMEQWRQQADVFTAESLTFIRGFIPPHIFTYSEQQFKAETSTTWPLGLIKRIWQKKVLWLTRLSRVDIERLHEADLFNKYNFQGQALDLMEIAAIYATLPGKFWNDPSGKKNQWRGTLEKTLQTMMEQDAKGQLPPSKKKNPLYKPSSALYQDRASLYAFDAVSGKDALNPRTSFKDLGSGDHAAASSEAVSSSATSVKSMIQQRNQLEESSFPKTTVSPSVPRKSVQVDPTMKASIAQALQQKMNTRPLNQATTALSRTFADPAEDTEDHNKDL